MISYKPLWKLLTENDKKKMDLLSIADISTATLAKLGKNKPVNLVVIDRICTYFDCQISDVIEYVRED